MDRLFAGVDNSKDSFCAWGLEVEGNECFSGSYSTDSDGFCKFLENDTAHCSGRQAVLVAMESTGCYHIYLFSPPKGFRPWLLGPC
jgi:hypothetical protein